MIGIGIIVAESTATMSAENTSRWLLPLWVKLFGPISPAHWEVVHHYIRKTGHFVGYGLVSLGFFDSWRVTLEHRWPLWRVRFRYAAGLALLCTLLLASWDEWHQSFFPGGPARPTMWRWISAERSWRSCFCSASSAFAGNGSPILVILFSRDPLRNRPPWY